ncbi:drug resistance transporter, EmrB/QacA subfamily [Streptoalloteichus tenebrarius]|uniref:Drug resistance transporter, EmrB/QacA subfamily n=1 Tax=Streptoalloteichus tenebrarius (strain ATCC 17920 / DSM 40477 / JCM 4838 / CBS 697.72 / NBRC 16177 / NCIMB 11028 / NRRL B-12390 / A12253. 1 / ISP 5477) TaxID=1933 RepID=A0ABT1HQT8_STRSD|nr:MFS transporter [Streptoalloteichus tenebrarius]MCP2257810.1 drug resistance transporter, EmrB/QacA subfamily [Streptoalloteichus tenebrarius]BFE99826.1 DHA2 family efflux MFS transporter permease subunit [Streptoalloteichus tenebrarius]
MPAQTPSARGRLILVVLCAAQFMISLDTTVVTVGLPVIQRELGVAPAELQWVTTAYTLTFGGLLMLAGRFGDLFGRRRMLVVGLAVFTAASLLCGVSQAGWQLFAARGLQGVGAAIVIPASLSVVTTSFAEGPERNRAMGLWAVIATGGAITGYALGGVVAGLLGWRWIFFINLPLGVFAVGSVLRLLAADTPTQRQRLDVPGAATMTAGLLLLVFAITSVTGHGVDETVVAAATGAVVLLAAFVLVERGHPAPLVRFGLFRNRNVVAGNVINAVNAGTSMVVTFLATLYLQKVLGLPPFLAGIAFAPVSILIMLVGRRTAPLVARFGARTLLRAGAVVTALGALWLSRMTVDGSYLVTVLPGILMTGLGAGLSFAPSMIVATSGVADDDQGLASGLVSTAQQVGGATGLAVFATVATAGMESAGGPEEQALVSGFHLAYLAVIILPVTTFVATTLVRVPSAPASPASPASSVSPASSAATGSGTDPSDTPEATPATGPDARTRTRATGGDTTDGELADPPRS